MIFERQNLKGKVAIITGGAKGVGRGIAEVFTRAGASVVLTARTAEVLQKTVADLEAKGHRAIAVPGDATSLEDAQRTVKAAMDTFGRVDFMINNVGGSKGAHDFDEIDAERMIYDIRLNLISGLQFVQLLAPELRKNRGAVVNISSRASQHASSRYGSYGVAKAALEAMTPVMARALAPEVRVNTISLGTIETDAYRGGMPQEAKDRLTASLPLRRVGDVEDIALAALYFCTENGYATGSVLNVDGGLAGVPS